MNGAQGPSGFPGIDVRRHEGVYEATTATATKLNFALNVLRLFHVGHLVKNRRAALSLAWHEWLLCKAKNARFPAASSRCRQNLKYENFTSLFGRINQKLHQKTRLTCCTIIFPHSINQIIGLRR